MKKAEKKNKNGMSSDVNYIEMEKEFLKDRKGVEMEDFIEKYRKGVKKYPYINDLAAWKKKFKLDPSQKVFIVNGVYPDIKEALINRGWIENKDLTSPCYDLIFTLKNRDIDQNNLQEFQITNHHKGNANITTKNLLTANLKNMKWACDQDYREYYPRCYDLSDQEQLEEFLSDFKLTKAESILKLFLIGGTDNNDNEISEKTVRVALNVIERSLRDWDDVIDQKVRSFPLHKES